MKSASHLCFNYFLSFMLKALVSKNILEDFKFKDHAMT